MKLKNILITVTNIEKSKQFYGDIFGLSAVLEQEGNVILTEGLVLQEKRIWENVLEKEVISPNHGFELYFEENDLEAFTEKLNRLYPDTEYITELTEFDWGQKIVRFYDPDKNLIEVRTPY